MANAILNPRNYAKITGIALLLVAVLGIVLSSTGTDGKYGLFCSSPTATTCEGAASDTSFLAFDWTHNILHVVLAAIALTVGFASLGVSNARPYAMTFGAVYLVLGLLGFIVPNLAMLHLELGENFIHLAIGAYGLLAAFIGSTTGTTPAPRPGRPPCGARKGRLRAPGCASTPSGRVPRR